MLRGGRHIFESEFTILAFRLLCYLRYINISGQMFSRPGRKIPGPGHGNSFAHMADPAASAEKSPTFQGPSKGSAKYQGRRKTSPSAGRQWSTCARLQLLKSLEEAKSFDNSKMGGRGPDFFC